MFLRNVVRHRRQEPARLTRRVCRGHDRGGHRDARPERPDRGDVAKSDPADDDARERRQAPEERPKGVRGENRSQLLLRGGETPGAHPRIIRHPLANHPLRIFRKIYGDPHDAVAPQQRPGGDRRHVIAPQMNAVGSARERELRRVVDDANRAMTATDRDNLARLPQSRLARKALRTELYPSGASVARGLRLGSMGAARKVEREKLKGTRMHKAKAEKARAARRALGKGILPYLPYAF